MLRLSSRFRFRFHESVRFDIHLCFYSRVKLEPERDRHLELGEQLGLILDLTSQLQAYSAQLERQREPSLRFGKEPLHLQMVQQHQGRLSPELEWVTFVSEGVEHLRLQVEVVYPVGMQSQLQKSPMTFQFSVLVVMQIVFEGFQVQALPFLEE